MRSCRILRGAMEGDVGGTMDGGSSRSSPWEDAAWLWLAWGRRRRAEQEEAVAGGGRKIGEVRGKLRKRKESLDIYGRNLGLGSN